MLLKYQFDLKTIITIVMSSTLIQQS